MIRLGHDASAVAVAVVSVCAVQIAMQRDSGKRESISISQSVSD